MEFNDNSSNDGITDSIAIAVERVVETKRLDDWFKQIADMISLFIKHLKVEISRVEVSSRNLSAFVSDIEPLTRDVYPHHWRQWIFGSRTVEGFAHH